MVRVGGKISGFDLVQPPAAEKSHWQWGGLWCAAGFRQMGRMAGLVVAKRLIDIIRATDNSVLAGPRRSLARWRGLHRCVWKVSRFLRLQVDTKHHRLGLSLVLIKWYFAGKKHNAGFLQFCCHLMLARERRSILSVIEGLHLLCPNSKQIYEGGCTLKQTPHRLGFKIGLSSGAAGQWWINWSANQVDSAQVDCNPTIREHKPVL